MASIYDLKPKFQSLLRPLTRGLAHLGITANQVTLFAFFLSIATGVALCFGPDHPLYYLLLPLILFLRMALNAIDGMLAREHKMKSRFGAILNEMTDVLSDAALYLPFAFTPGCSPILIVLIVVLAMATEMAGVVSIQIGGSRRYEGPMGKSDRAFVFGCLAIIIGLGLPINGWINGIWGLVLILLLVTLTNRIRKALQETEKRSHR
jgi:CDP-diacylglycerol--glycerol-3-phosphate 3-phosphatidyltransferase